MKKGVTISILGFLGFLALLLFIGGFSSKLGAQTLKGKSYFGGDSPSFDFSIPRAWGELEGISSHDQSDTLYFQTSDGTIRAVRVVLTTRSGKHFFKKIAEAKISRK